MSSLKRITQRRILGDIDLLTKDPIDNMRIYCFEHNLFEYFFLIHDLKEDYAGGEYIGKIVFDGEYPKTPPEFYMFTPSGRFEPGKKLCLSNSKYHQSEWDPKWSIFAILNGFISVFVEDKDEGISHIKASKEERQKLAKNSIKWNEEYGKRNNNLYNLLKTQYLGHNYKKEKVENLSTSKKEMYKKFEKLAKNDKSYAKMLKEFRKNIKL